METLTLARFVLELSLQCYKMVDQSASCMGAAALWLALKMKKSNQKMGKSMSFYNDQLIMFKVEMHT